MHAKSQILDTCHPQTYLNNTDKEYDHEFRIE